MASKGFIKPIQTYISAYARFTRNKKFSRKGKTQEVDFIVRSVSATLGEGCLTHNDRSFTADNVDGSRTHLNIAYVNEPIKEVYHKLFDEALEKYNAKQTRNDRKIADYYEKIRTSKLDVYFTAAGLIDIPDEKELREMIEEIRKSA